MKTLVICVFFFCFCYMALARPQNPDQVLSVLHNTEKPLSFDYETKIQPDRRGRQTQKITQAKEFIEVENDWTQSLTGVWDWLVNGMRKFGKNMANIASQIMTS